MSRHMLTFIFTLVYAQSRAHVFTHRCTPSQPSAYIYACSINWLILNLLDKNNLFFLWSSDCEGIYCQYLTCFPDIRKGANLRTTSIDNFNKECGHFELKETACLNE